jgi:hypothetical protein
MIDMRRRQFITLLGGAAVWPLAAHAQQTGKYLVGFLNSQSPGPFSHMVAALLRGMNEAGIVVERDVEVDYRWAEGRYDRLPALARELVSRRVAVWRQPVASRSPSPQKRRPPRSRSFSRSAATRRDWGWCSGSIVPEATSRA